MCESLENRTPSEKRHMICATLPHFEDRRAAIKILSLEYEMNNIGEKKAIKWLANIFDVFEDEIEDSAHSWLDLGEGMKEFLSANRPDSTLSLTDMVRLLELDCSSMSNGTSYTSIRDAIGRMSALEVKWFIRYWLRKPRNGVNKSTVEKAMSDHYQKNIKQYSVGNSLTSLVHYLENDLEPPELVHGNFVKPMLAKKYLGKLPEQFIMDIKYDGNRYQIHSKDNSVIIFNRKGKIVTEQYADIVAIVESWEADDFILDTEIYPVKQDGSPAPHQTLATRVHSKDKQQAISKCPVQLVVFDCLLYQGQSILNDSYGDRLEYLETIVPSEFVTQTFRHGNVDAAYNVAINGGFEGIMIKDLNAPYQSKRTVSLLKHKPPRVELDVVITSGEYGKGKRAGVIGTYGVSVRDGTDYVDIGKVGSGISEEEMYSLDTQLKRIVDSYSGGTYHFLPRVVLEVTCDFLTKNQDGSYGMRFPRILRIRDDKYPTDCNTIEEIEELCSNIY
tara:strand:- start:75 stop:1583 length:1509 start_codon:yes stop_codon:yes gene_type:complete